MANTKKQNFLHGAVILTAGLAVIKVLGAIYKIPIANILGAEGEAGPPHEAFAVRRLP